MLLNSDSTAQVGPLIGNQVVSSQLTTFLLRYDLCNAGLLHYNHMSSENTMNVIILTDPLPNPQLK